MNSKFLTLSFVFVVITIVQSQIPAAEAANDGLLSFDQSQINRDLPQLLERHKNKLTELDLARMKQMNDYQRSMHQKRFPNARKFERYVRQNPANEI